MAFNFDEDASPSQYITLPSTLHIGSGDFAISMWLRITNLLTGSGLKYIATTGGSTDAESFRIYVDEDDAGLNFRGEGQSGVGGGGDWAIDNGAEAGTMANWQHYLFQRNGSTYEQYVIGSAEGTDTVTNVAAFDIDRTWYLGARDDLNSARFFDGDMAEFAFWDGRSFSTDEIGAMADGFSPLFFRRNLTVYIPMVRQYQDYAQAIAVTNNNTTIASHCPKIIHPHHTFIYFNAAGAAGPVVKNVSESMTVGIDDTTALLSLVSPEDTATVGITETTALLAQRSVDDTIAAILDDSTTLVAQWSIEETITLILNEATAIQVAINPTDTTQVTLNEALAILTAVRVAEPLVLQLNEVVAAQILVAVSEALQVTIQDAVNVLETVLQDVADTLQITLQEATQMLVQLRPSDLLAIILLEDAGKIASFLAIADTIAPKMQDLVPGITLFRMIDLEETSLTVQVLESTNVLTMVSVAESLPVTLEEAIAQLETTLIDLADTLTISIQDAATLMAGLGVEETLAIILDEPGPAILKLQDIQDTLNIGLGEALTILVSINLAPETLRVQILDSVIVDITTEGVKAVSDILSIVLEASTAVMVQANLEETLRVQLTDQVALLHRTIELTDTVNLPLLDAVAIFRMIELAQETLPLTLQEAAQVVQALTVSDFLRIVLGESATKEEIALALQAYTERLRTDFMGRNTPGPYTLSPSNKGRGLFNG